MVLRRLTPGGGICNRTRPTPMAIKPTDSDWQHSDCSCLFFGALGLAGGPVQCVVSTAIMGCQQVLLNYYRQPKARVLVTVPMGTILGPVG